VRGCYDQSALRLRVTRDSRAKLIRNLRFISKTGPKSLGSLDLDSGGTGLGMRLRLEMRPVWSRISNASETLQQVTSSSLLFSIASPLRFAGNLALGLLNFLLAGFPDLFLAPMTGELCAQRVRFVCEVSATSKINVGQRNSQQDLALCCCCCYSQHLKPGVTPDPFSTLIMLLTPDYQMRQYSTSQLSRRRCTYNSLVHNYAVDSMS